MVLTEGDGRMLFCNLTQHGSCADITHARQLGLVRLLDGGPTAEIRVDAGYQGLGAQTDGRVVRPPHREFKKNAHKRHRASRRGLLSHQQTADLIPGTAGVITKAPLRFSTSHRLPCTSSLAEALRIMDRRRPEHTFVVAAELGWAGISNCFGDGSHGSRA